MKYRKELLQLLNKEFRSTNNLKIALSKQTGKTINWLSLVRWLEALEQEGLIIKNKLSGIFFWKKP